MPEITAELRRRANSIAAAIILLGGAVLLIMWTLAAESIFAARQVAMDRTRAEGRNLALALAEEATRLLDDIVRAGDLVATHIRESHGTSTCTAGRARRRCRGERSRRRSSVPMARWCRAEHWVVS